MIYGCCTGEEAEDRKAPHSPDLNVTQAAGGGRTDQRPDHVRRARRYDLVVMAASAGGVQALQAVLSSLPADFPAPIVVMPHRSTDLPNLLAQGLVRRTRLAVKMAGPSETMQAGTVYLATADLHLTVCRDGTLSLSDGRKIRHVRSSANPLFESAAEAFGGRVMAVVLTGGDRDATDGVQSVKAHGGTIIA
jgi:two-component system chemotaxis response regulator CheB